MAKFIQGDLFDSPPDQQPDSEGEIPPDHAQRPRSIARHFLGWDRPILDSATDFLIGAQAGQRLIDLSDLLVVVPTQHAGRRLREALATCAAEKDGAVVPPLIVPPESLIAAADAPPADALPVAGRAQILLLWADVLRQIELDHFRHVFPIDPVERSFNWAVQTGADLVGMRNTLGEAGLSISTAAAILAEHGMEPARWRQLADLEQRVQQRLTDAGLIDAETARHESVRRACLPHGIGKLILLGTPDPTPMVLDALARIACATPVEVAIFAPPKMANHFDNWGRPITELWSHRPLDIPAPEKTIHLASAPSSQAEQTVAMVNGYRDPAGLVAIGIPDEEVVAPLARGLEAVSLAAFNPAGESMQSHEIHYLLRVFGELLSARSYSAFAQLIRIPDFILAAGAQYTEETGMELDHLALLQNFDTLYSDHLPDTLEHVQNAFSKRPKSQRAPEQAFILTLINRWLKRFEKSPLSESLPEFLAMVYGHRKFNTSEAADRIYTEFSSVLLSFLEELESSFTEQLRFPAPPADLLQLLLQLLANQPFYPERESANGSSTIDLQGWLELLWEDAPHLIVTGFNEGKVPDAIVGDAYLPNQARSALGIRDNDHRLARDAYYLSALIESRRTAGRIDLIVGKTADDGTPLGPSRLLFLCPDDALPSRTRQLFDSAPDQTTGQPEPWARAWQLDPPPLPDDAKIRRYLSVTQFSDYLSCPFRFFLKHGLGMEEFERDKMEMDSRDFGNLCHNALENFGRDESIRDSTDEVMIAAYLIEQLDREVTHRYGSILPVPVLIQLESAKQRLTWAARIQAAERAKGWAISEVEWAVDKDPETKVPTWSIDGMPISFKIDRIDRHEDSGELRVLDYKTSDKALAPADTHLAKLRDAAGGHEIPDWAQCAQHDGRTMRWTNLQLPLYILALKEKFDAEAQITTGLFKLPKAVTETRIDLWEDLDQQTLDSARQCAGGVIGSIRGQHFWPPTPTKQAPSWDPFKKLFFDDPLAAVKAPDPA
ncbi:MAG: PD-(D/E)XK nuclease family protein [Verrucomicrobiales bacterium]